MKTWLNSYKKLRRLGSERNKYSIKYKRVTFKDELSSAPECRVDILYMKAPVDQRLCEIDGLLPITQHECTAQDSQCDTSIAPRALLVR